MEEYLYDPKRSRRRSRRARTYVRRYYSSRRRRYDPRISRRISRPSGSDLSELAGAAIGAAVTEYADVYAATKYSTNSFVSGNVHGIKYPHLAEAVIGFVLPLFVKGKIVRGLGYGIGSAGLANVTADLANSSLKNTTAVYDPSKSSYAGEIL
ncbi:MAG: hypothetical protein QXL94_06380 [Candidatus Parvarchaeum sp.]